MKKICGLFIFLIFLAGVQIGLIIGFIIYNIDEKITENQRENLIVLYEVER